MGCRIDRRNLWSIRLRFEVAENYKLHFGSSFVTLTYDEEHYKGLNKKDLQLFIKRLRERIRRSDKDLRQNVNFKYYAVGELGSRTMRGHYHIVFTGLERNFLASYIRKTWKFGLFKVDVVNNARIRYLLKYMDKQIFNLKLCKDKDSENYGLCFDEVKKEWYQPPFAIFSKGIGSATLKNQIGFASETGLLKNGERFVSYPSYYAKKFGVDTAELSAKRQEAMKNTASALGMTVAQYQSALNYYTECTEVGSASLGDTAVSRVGLKNARETYKRVNKLDCSDYSELVKKSLGD